MDRLKTVLFYSLAVVSLLLASLWFTRPGDPSNFQLPPTLTPQPTATPTRTPLAATETAGSGCVPTAGTGINGYMPDIPFSVDLAPPDLPGERMVIFGTIYASDCATPLPGALVEVWQADAEGQYDRTAPYILRGKMRTDAHGRYEFATIKPGSYQMGEGAGPAHIHYQVTYQEEGPFATRLLFQGDPTCLAPWPTRPWSFR